MKIYKYDVPNELIERYCRVIIAIEKQYSAHLDEMRSKIHNEIFDHVGCHRSLFRKDDREFSTALNKTVLDLTI